MSLSRFISYFQGLLILFYLFNLVCSQQTRDSYEFSLHSGWSTCSHTANASVSFLNNVNLLLSDFNEQSSTRSFYNTSIGDNLDRVYGYYLCRGDVSLEVCNECIINGTRFTAGTACEFIDGSFASGMCFFKYSNYSMFGSWKVSITHLGFIDTNVSNYEQFNFTLSSTIDDLINEAAFESQQNDGSVLGFATKEANVTQDQTIYSLAQCTPDIVGENCSQCLQNARSDLRGLADGAPAAYATNLKCHLRYDNISFYDLGE